MLSREAPFCLLGDSTCINNNQKMHSMRTTHRLTNTTRLGLTCLIAKTGRSTIRNDRSQIPIEKTNDRWWNTHVRSDKPIWQPLWYLLIEYTCKSVDRICPFFYCCVYIYIYIYIYLLIQVLKTTSFKLS